MPCIILGKSIAAGQGYRSIHLCNAPVMTQFPMVFPALLAFTHLFTDKPLAAKIMVMALGCLISLLVWFLSNGGCRRSAPLRVLRGSWVSDQLHRRTAR